MSKAVAQSVIKYRVKSGVYTTHVVSPNGDLVQYYSGTQSDLGQIYMDFSAIKPKLYLESISSRQLEAVKYVSDIEVKVNGIKMEFSASTHKNTTAFGTHTGQFTLVKSNATLDYYDGIQINANLLEDSQFEPIVITMTGSVLYGTQTDSLSASYTIPVMQYTGNSPLVTIKAGNFNNFTITKRSTEDADKVFLVAKVYDIQSATEYTSGVTFEWQKAAATNEGWEAITQSGIIGTTSMSGDTLKIDHTMIAALGDFRVIAKGSDGVILGTDTQQVIDATDELVINLHPTPADETIDEDVSGNGQVVYAPQVADRSTGEEKTGQFAFKFSVKDAYGNPLNKWQNGADDELNEEMATTKQATYTVTRAQCQQANGNLSITVFAVDK